MIVVFTILLLLYVNAIRFFELKQNTSMVTWKQYWFNMLGIVYSLNIIGLILIIYLISKTVYQH